MLKRNLYTDTKLQHFDYFEKCALSVFAYQSKENEVYKKYLSIIGCNPKEVHSIDQIPFLPVSLFKQHVIKTGIFQEERIFESSSTTGQGVSKHFVASIAHYHQVASFCFESIFGPSDTYCHLALLPSYLERGGSSLIDMVQYFMDKSHTVKKGFYLTEWQELHNQIIENSKKKIPTVLWGVSFAMLDFAEYLNSLPDKESYQGLIVIETGGMKGRRKEIIREELYSYIRKGLGDSVVLYSEYGMTEMMSQCYALDGRFVPPPHVKVFGRNTHDPFSFYRVGRAKALNIIDLANIDSCCFLSLSDIGNLYTDGSFEVLGRIDESDIRGCNLMYQ